MTRVAILGAGGHARAVADCWGENCLLVTPEQERALLEWLEDDDVLLLGVGSAADRKRLFQAHGNRLLERGIQKMPGSYVARSARLGNAVLVNVGAQVNHDCVVGDFCIVGPGAILCGGVVLGESCQIGAGAIIVQEVRLDAATNVPAGTLVCGPDDFRRPQRVVRA